MSKLYGLCRYEENGLRNPNAPCSRAGRAPAHLLRVPAGHRRRRPDGQAPRLAHARAARRGHHDRVRVHRLHHHRPRALPPHRRRTALPCEPRPRHQRPRPRHLHRHDPRRTRPRRLPLRVPDGIRRRTRGGPLRPRDPAGDRNHQGLHGPAQRRAPRAGLLRRRRDARRCADRLPRARAPRFRPLRRGPLHHDPACPHAPRGARRRRRQTLHHDRPRAHHLLRTRPRSLPPLPPPRHRPAPHLPPRWLQVRRLASPSRTRPTPAPTRPCPAHGDGEAGGSVSHPSAAAAAHWPPRPETETNCARPAGTAAPRALQAC